MTRLSSLFACLALLLGGCGASSAETSMRPPHASAPAQLTVVELYESQGCSSCPPTNANVNGLSTRDDLLTLMFGVTYWDQLGWPDTFARPEFTARQRDYARGLHHDTVFTPQVVLNGRRDIVGNVGPTLLLAIAQAAQTTTFTAAVTSRGSAVSVAPIGGATRADVWLVRYDPRTRNVPISAGENGGRELAHINVVRQLVRLGSWDGASTQRFDLPVAIEAGLRTAILVQGPNGGPIVGAARLPA